MIPTHLTPYGGCPGVLPRANEYYAYNVSIVPSLLGSLSNVGYTDILGVCSHASFYEYEVTQSIQLDLHIPADYQILCNG